ncbi:MAG TPA: hypothetical protein VGL81_29375 [Polyangiaceae bacterium]
MRHSLRPLAAAAAVFLLPVAAGLGCSSSHAPAGSSACTALETCCASLSGEEATSCHDALSGATSSACASTLAALVQAGGCTAEGFDAGNPGTGTDGGVPCTLTGTCPGGSSGSDVGSDAGGTATGPQCVTAGACEDGTPYSTCVETSSSGACNAAVVFASGETFPCASCGDCVSATLSAESYCSMTTTTTPDAGPDTGPSCGTAPVLHPETTPGVYCPFTEAGSIHCAAAQECCETPSTVTNGSTCEAAGTTCPIAGSLAWACNGPIDCQGNAAGPACCAAGTVAPDPVCGFDRGTNLTGSHCATSCAPNEVDICASTTDPCPTGTLCTPFKVAGVVLGTCL